MDVQEGTLESIELMRCLVVFLSSLLGLIGAAEY